MMLCRFKLFTRALVGGRAGVHHQRCSLGILGASAASAAVYTYLLSASSSDDDPSITKHPIGVLRAAACSCEEAPSSSTTATTSTSTGAPTAAFRLEDVYVIEKLVGEGAYGEVFQARRKQDGKLVALKSMPRVYTGKTDFEREVAALQLLSKQPHENIVQLYELHRDDQSYYLAMELIQGGELLHHLIENGPYSEGLAASFLRQFAEAICFVHSNGLVHADLKPENLLLSSFNDMDQAKLKLVDFGCARSHDLSRKEMHLPMQEFALGCSFLHMVALGNQFELEKMLQERPALVNFRDYDFRTPLHLAASEGHVDIARYLIMKGARVNRSDRWGGSPLDDAHRHRHSEVIQYLREHGATFGTRTQLPRFIQAASEGDVEEVKALLEFGSIDLDQGDYDRRTALHLACGEGRMEVVELLCQEGADVNVEDRWGNRPLDDASAAKKSSASIMHLLKKYGAKSVKNPDLEKQVLVSRIAGFPSKAPTKKARGKKKDQDETFSGTIAYSAPELFTEGASPTPKSDMWAAGVIMYILLTGSHPFDKSGEKTDDEIQECILKLDLKNEDKNNSNLKSKQLLDEMVFDERVDGLSDSCVELMRQLMHPDPVERMSSEKFLRHPWIQGLTASWTTMGKTHAELKAFWRHKFRAEILKKFAKSIGRSSATGEKQLSEGVVAEMFRRLDLQKTGVLELDDIWMAFHDLGVSDKNIRTIFASADLDGTGVIHYDEFRTLLMADKDAADCDGPGLDVNYLQQRFKSHILSKFQEEDGTASEKEQALSDENKLREVFNTIDLEGNGVLDPHDIRVFLRSVGEPEDVISRMVASMDINHDGDVSWSEFLDIMGAKRASSS